MYFLSEGVLQITLVSSSAAFDRMSMAAAEMVQVNTSVSMCSESVIGMGWGWGRRSMRSEEQPIDAKHALNLPVEQGWKQKDEDK